MHRLKRIHIQGFRRLADVNLEVRPLMVLIGANGVGKTSLLQSFSLLSATAKGKLNERLSALGGFSNVLTRGKAEALSFRVEMEIPQSENVNYDIELGFKGLGYAILREELTQENEGYQNPFKYIDSKEGQIKYFQKGENKLLSPNWEHNLQESSLSQVPKMYQQPEELRRILGSISQYHVLDVSNRSPVKLPQEMRPVDQPGPNGEDLVPFLYNMRESEPHVFEAILDTMTAVFPDLESLAFPPVAAGMLAMTWKDRHFRKPWYMNELSEGTLRFLWLASILQSPNLPTITIIDEPEVSLHPEMLCMLAELMREASKRTQLVIATHSERLVRFMKPEEVVVMDLDAQGNATALWADSLDLEDWLEDYGLDELWRMGQLGGRL